MNLLEKITNITYKCEECSDIIARLCVIKFDPKIRSICPCSVCLVKMMCKKLCEPRNDIFARLSVDEKTNLFDKITDKDEEVYIESLLEKYERKENET